MASRITVFALLAATACSQKTPESPAATGTRLFQHELLGIAFEIPEDWQVVTQPTEDGTILVFSAPVGSPSYFATTTLQARPSDDGNPSNTTLGDALIRAHAQVVKLPKFNWHHREPTVVAGKPAIRYGFEVELHESHQIKQGILLASSGLLFNLTYSGTPAVFAEGITDFERILQTMTVD